MEDLVIGVAPKKVEARVEASVKVEVDTYKKLEKFIKAKKIECVFTGAIKKDLREITDWNETIKLKVDGKKVSIPVGTRTAFERVYCICPKCGIYRSDFEVVENICESCEQEWDLKTYKAHVIKSAYELMKSRKIGPREEKDVSDEDDVENEEEFEPTSWGTSFGNYTDKEMKSELSLLQQELKLIEPHGFRIEDKLSENTKVILGKVYEVVFNYLKNMILNRDIKRSPYTRIHDVFLKMIEDENMIKTLTHHRNPIAWLTLVTRNLVISEQRKVEYDIEVDFSNFFNNDEMNVENFMDSIQIKKSERNTPTYLEYTNMSKYDIAVALKMLKPEHRYVVINHTYYGKEYDEIAKELNKPRSTIGVWHMRGMNALKEYFGATMPDDEPIEEVA